MSGLFETLEVLQSCSANADAGLSARVAAVFRDEYRRLFEEHKQAYLAKVVEAQFITSAVLSKLLNYRSRSGINAMKVGSISLDRFDMVRGTVGERVPWPSPSDRKTLALIKAVTFVATVELRQKVREPLDRDGLECLETALAGDDRELWDLQSDREEDAWIKAMVRRVEERQPLEQKLDAQKMRRLLAEWGPAYIRTKDALCGFVR